MLSKTPFTGDPEGDHLLESDSLALLIGMLLDEHISHRVSPS